MDKERDWNKIAESLQIRDVPEQNMPRLLLDCIIDLQRSRSKVLYMKTGIESAILKLQTNMDDTVV